MSKTSLILSHYDGRLGKVDYLEKFLKFKGFQVSHFLHPLDDYANLQTTYMNAAGKTMFVKRTHRGLWNYIEDMFFSIGIIRKSEIDICFTLSNFDTMPAIVCRSVFKKKIRKIIYFPSDYSGKRFRSKLLNFAYIHVEKMAIRHADLVVSNTKRAEAMRIDLGLDVSKSIIIPNGVRMPSPKPIFIKKHISKRSFIYVGDVNNEHGLYDLIKALTPHIQKLVIMGSGKDWDKTVHFAQKQSFELETHFKKDREFVLRYLQKFNGFGLAPYNRSADWTYFCSPVKVGEYIACGVPVLMSEVPEISEVVKREGYGVTFDSLDASILVGQLESFDTGNYRYKAKKFYQSNNAYFLFDKLGI